MNPEYYHNIACNPHVCTFVCCRVRQWTGDTRTWYKAGGAPFGSAGQSYIIIYAILVLVFIILMLFRGSTFHAWTLGSSQRMHTKMTHK